MPWFPRRHHATVPVLDSGFAPHRDGYTVPPVNELDAPDSGAGVPLYPFTGYQVNPARLNGEDINPNNAQTMRFAYDDGVMLYNGVDGITEKRFGPGQFYVLSDSNPNQTVMTPHGYAQSQVLTSSDIQGGPARRAAMQDSAPGAAGGPVLSGAIMNPGGC